MNRPDLSIVQIANSITGHLDRRETEMLYNYARGRSYQTIVEIGNYHGRSTVVLALGAKESHSVVWSIDPHQTKIADGTQYSAGDNAAFLRTLVKHGVEEVVRPITLESYQVAKAWERPIDLLFIDGLHDYDSVAMDFKAWECFIKEDGCIALHDSSKLGKWPGPVQVVEEAVAMAVWRVANFADATTVLERVR